MPIIPTDSTTTQLQARGAAGAFRAIWDNPIFRNGQQAAIFAWMVSTAAEKPIAVRGSFGRVELDVGQVWFVERDLAAYFACDRGVIRRTVSLLAQAQLIDLDRPKGGTCHGTKVTILDYRRYQGGAAEVRP